MGKRELPEFIPENIFYRLAMKAKNEVAEKFQALVADEIIPSIRKHGMYATPITLDTMIADPDFAIGLLTNLKEERAARLKAEQERAKVEAQNQIMLPKADYFDKLVDAGATQTDTLEMDSALFNVESVREDVMKEILSNNYSNNHN